MSQRLFRLTAALAVLALAALPHGLAAQADFTRYVSLGDSLTAGFEAGSINQKFQQNSYPALLAGQFGITSFQQPLVSEPGLPGILRLNSLVPSLSIAPTPGSGQPVNINLPRPYDNMAVPGATLHDLLTKTLSTSANDPTDLILRRLGFTQLQQGLSLHPTFVTLWIGNNDALAAATSGIAIEGVTLTPPAQFDAEYRLVAGAIAASGAKMAVANIANVTSIPFVTTIPRFVTLPNGVSVNLVGPDGPIPAGDFVLLTASADIAAGHGIPGFGPPLTDREVLTAGEAAFIQDHINHYNATIEAVAAQVGAALIDAKAALVELSTPGEGVHVGGVTYTSAFLTGGAFGYDGVHPTAFGYAFIANQFVDAINAKFGTHVEPVDLTPFVFGTKGLFDQPLATPPFVLSAEAGKQIVDMFNQKPGKRPRRPRH